jgi:ATP-binding cassette, subfamily F, member 3
MISVANVSFGYGYAPVLELVTFLVPNGKKVGIVGPNGAGKSTLFKLLTKKEFPSTGKIEITGSLSMVQQEVKNDPDMHAASTIESYVDPQSRHTSADINRILDGLEFDRSKAAKELSNMSGGQKTKLALARAFLAEPDILLLDEPTNFLDEAGTKWVMHFLGTYKKTVLIVSHDLALLDKHISQVLYVNPHTHTVDRYTGNYTAFVKTKKQQDELLKRKVANEQQHIARMEKGLVNLRKMTSKKGVHQRVMQERKIQRIKDKLPDLPQELKSMRVAFPLPSPVGEIPIRAEHIDKSYEGNAILKDVSLYVRRGERLALIGPNGVGKTTLIKILTKTIEPDKGVVIHNESLNLGYYSQEFQTFDEQKTLEEVVAETCAIDVNKIYPFLGRFLFPRERLHQFIGTLSGGEKTRLSIALLMLQSYNLLILDEPTTYLDVMSQRIILEALKDYKGAMILVSHTKEFVAELKPERVLILPENKTQFWTPDLGEKVTEI